MHYDLIHYIEMTGGITPQSLLPSELEKISYPTFPFRSNRKASANKTAFISEEDQIIMVVLSTMLVLGIICIWISREVQEINKINKQLVKNGK